MRLTRFSSIDDYASSRTDRCDLAQAPFNDPLLAAPNFNIGFNAWTAAARLGLIGYAMLPLAVTLALKQVRGHLSMRSLQRH